MFPMAQKPVSDTTIDASPMAMIARTQSGRCRAASAVAVSK